MLADLELAKRACQEERFIDPMTRAMGLAVTLWDWFRNRFKKTIYTKRVK